MFKLKAAAVALALCGSLSAAAALPTGPSTGPAYVLVSITVASRTDIRQTTLGEYESGLSCQWAAITLYRLVSDDLAKEPASTQAAHVVYQCVPQAIPDAVAASPGAYPLFLSPPIVVVP